MCSKINENNDKMYSSKFSVISVYWTPKGIKSD